MSEDKRIKWQPTWIDKLRELRGAGLSMEACAGEINRLFPGAAATKGAVVRQCHTHGIVGKPKPERTEAAPKPKVERKSPPQRNALTFARPKPPVPAAQRKPAPPDPAAPPKPDCAPIGIKALTGKTCRWPVEGGDQPGGLYCGAPAHPKRRSYCAYHRWLELTPAGRRRLTA